MLVLGELELPGHAIQVATDCAAEVAEYVPAPHDVQVAEDVAAGVAEYFPAAHDVQSAVPVVSLYVPNAHAEHAPSGPV
jgi:hypothetical protein